MTKNVLALTFFLASVAFGSGPGTPSIVGKWAETNSTDRIEFKADGTCSGAVVYVVDRTLKTIDGTYSVNGETVGITFNGGFKMILNVKTTASGLAVTYLDGGPFKQDSSTATFQRR